MKKSRKKALSESKRRRKLRKIKEIAKKLCAKRRKTKAGSSAKLITLFNVAVSRKPSPAFSEKKCIG